MVEILSISGLASALIAVSFGVLVIVKNWRENSNRLFFLMTLALAVWGFSYWKWLSSDTYDQALFWVRLLSVGSVFIPVFFFHWTTVLFGKGERYRLLIFSIYTASIFISAFFSSSLFVSSVEEKLFFPFWPTAGILYSIYFFVIYSSVILYSIYFLLKELRNEKDTEKRGRIIYILIGATLGFGGGLTNFPLWYDIPVIPIGNFLVMAFPFLLGYSALKHHLFSLKTVATEVLVFFISVILLIQAVLSESSIEFFLRFVFLIFVGSLGYLLIKSVYREVEARQQIEKLAKDLEMANERLKELDKLKSEFVSIASHQLRSPLAAIKGYSSLILEGSFGKASPAVSEAVEKIFDSSKGLAIVVEDFLNVSRIEQGRMKYDFVEADLKILAKKVIDELMPSVKKAKLDISLEDNGEGSYKASIDVGKIQQVITNIIDNSIKYTPQGSIKVRVEKTGNGKIRLSIKDTGVGMGEEILSALFEKFSREKDASKTNVSGTGLGLYVAKEMVEAHGGKIWAESPGKGKGSTFIVELNELEHQKMEKQVNKFAEEL